jgi:phospho-N-acetylmuramoyl-pentapeptide-transferase
MLESTIGLASFSFLMVSLLCPLLIWGLRSLKLIQPIRAELPADHQAKRGTPLMAGLILMTGAFITTLFRSDPIIAFLNMTFILFGLIGFADDFKKAYFQDPSGVSGRLKLLLQFIFTGSLLWYLMDKGLLDSNIVIFGNIHLSIPSIIYFVIILLFIVGTANAINFTDGLDGLLIVVAIPTYFFFYIITDQPGVQTFSLVMIGCMLGLLIYNIYPARAFMGDTGSLAIGGSLAFLAVIEKVEILIPILFFVYLAEQLSVILQVWYYKKTKLRIFRMAPIHYHFSLKYGWTENKIVIIFGIISWICALLSLLLWRIL